MVAKAKGDLFDFTVGGAGFHVTAHLIAIAALFIACFAIAGYISFRGDSIPASALKDQSEVLTKQGETWTFEKEFELTTLVQTTGDIVGKTGLVLPTDAVIVNSTLIVQVAAAGLGGGGADFGLEMGDVGSAVGGTVGNPDELTAVTNITTAARGTRLAGHGDIPIALSGQEEVYFVAATNITGTATTNPKVIATVQWTGSAPVAY